MENSRKNATVSPNKVVDRKYQGTREPSPAPEASVTLTPFPLTSAGAAATPPSTSKTQNQIQTGGKSSPHKRSESGTFPAPSSGNQVPAMSTGCGGEECMGENNPRDPNQQNFRSRTSTIICGNSRDRSGSHGSSIRRRSVLGPPSLFGEPHAEAVIPDLDFERRPSQDESATTLGDLDFYYGLIKRQILKFQSVTTGLFPEHSTDKDIGHVRSSIYANMAVWSLYQAYKRVDDDRGKTYELGQSCVAGMRGILTCWMVQAKMLEKFKSKQTKEFALHSRFSLETGSSIIQNDKYNHLQIDNVSLYLLFLVQCLASGLEIIYTGDEVKFVQNLVYFIERAYRTPDFGIWERGSIYNDGTCEVNASSIGMAKAALEAINGCNLFGEKGSSGTVVYVDIDAHNRNRSIFETLLPRESESKNVDVALISTVSWPAFATHDKGLYERTKSKILNNLEGKYGFKRFHRDGYGSVPEANLSRYGNLGNEHRAGGFKYPPGVIQQFDGIECEWPMFYAFMVIEAVFKGKDEQIEKYQNKLRKRIAYNEKGDPVLPKYYVVPSQSIPEERLKPGTQHRFAYNDGSSSPELHLWSQSLLLISDLLTSRLLNPHELDPISRHLPSYNRPKTGSRYSAFERGGGDRQGISSMDSVVQVITIAESMRLQAVLGTYGIQTQTPNELDPVQIWSQSDLVKLYQQLGHCEKLGLKGRPPRPIGCLGTSKIYRVKGQTLICYPLFFSASEFYLSHDMALLTDDIRSELKFVSRCWRLSGRPTILLLVTENNMRDPQFPTYLQLLTELKTGEVGGVKVKVSRFQNLLATSCLEHLDFLQNVDIKQFDCHPFQQLKNKDQYGYSTLTDIPVQKQVMEERRDFLGEFKDRSTDDIINEILESTHIFGRIQLLGIILFRSGFDHYVGDMTARQRLELLNRKAGSLRLWEAVRYSSSLLRKIVDSISPNVTQILVNGKQVTVGTVGQTCALFDKPMYPAEIHKAVYTEVQPFSVIAAVMQQELILYCGKLIATHPELFSGILKVRIGWIFQALDMYRKMDRGSQNQNSPVENIESCSPSEIRHLLFKVLDESEKLRVNFSTDPNDINLRTLTTTDSSKRMSIFQVRQINGCLTRVPEKFYSNIWFVLTRAPNGFYIAGSHIPQEPTLKLMTSTELTFAHMIETHLCKYSEPVYKQLVVELFCVLTAVLRRNPELLIKEKLCADILITEAIGMFKKDKQIPGDDIEETKLAFSNAPVMTTSGYFARAILNNMLKYSLTNPTVKHVSDYNCPVQ